MRNWILAASAVAALGLAACANYPNTSRQTGQGALGGAAVGAAAGAISGDVGVAEGAAVGAAAGAAIGAFTGCQKDNACPWSQNNSAYSGARTDPQTGRDYYVNSQTGCTYYANGEYRGGC